MGVILGRSLPAQNSTMDSLVSILPTIQSDSQRLEVMLELSDGLWRVMPDSAISLAYSAQALAEELGRTRDEAEALKLVGLGNILKGDWLTVLDYFERSLALYEQINDLEGESQLLNNIGGVYSLRGGMTKAAEYYFRSLKIAQELGDDLRIATALTNVGTTFTRDKNDYQKAKDYFLQSLPYATASGDNVSLADCTANLGEIFLKLNKPDSAIYYFETALENYGGGEGEIYALNELGKSYAAKQDYESAVQLQTEAVKKAEDLNSPYNLAQVLIGLGQSLKQQGNSREAITNFIRAEEISEEIEAAREQRDAYKGLAESYAMAGQFQQAYFYQEKLLKAEENLNEIDNNNRIDILEVQFKLDNQRTENELLKSENDLKEAEIQRASILRNFLFATAIFLIITVAGVSYSYWFARRSNRIITEERNRSESILLNILPEETAEELKHNGKVKAKRFEQVSVLFTDFKQFTEVSKGVSPEEIVKSVDYYFRNFDEIVSRHHLEKIKTIGDAYMCAGGLPVPNATHPQDAVSAGLEIVEFVKNTRAYPPEGIVTFDIRIGIHTGPVVAGVVGTKKFQYDIWGSTVNLASMMETNSEANRVNISNGTYELIKDRFSFEYRGEITGKHGGKYKMYFVGEPVPEPESVA